MKILMAEHSHYHALYRVGCHHLADYLAGQGHEILYISGPMNIFNLRYFVTGNPSKQDLVYGLRTWSRGGIRERPNLISYAPLTVLPIWRRWPFSSPWVAHNTLKFALPPLRRMLAAHGFATPDVLLVSQPFFAELMGSVEAGCKVYRLTDDIDKFPNMPSSIRGAERAAVAHADAVVVTAHPLVKKVAGYGMHKVQYIPNGVDYEHYQQPAPRPPEYTGDAPIVVYIGAIDSWFDLDTLAYCARALPGVRFVLIGAPRIDLTQIDDCPNVVSLGPRNYAQLPSYLQYASVGIIPFRVTPLIESVSPLKLYEYMACGLPVVSARWQELEKICPPAYLADDRETFLAGLRAALAEEGGRAESYRAFATQNSWQSRGQSLESLFFTLLKI